MLITKYETAYANSTIIAIHCRQVLALYTYSEYGDVVSIITIRRGRSKEVLNEVFCHAGILGALAGEEIGDPHYDPRSSLILLIMAGMTSWTSPTMP